ncbi:protein kinase domain-containing protein [Symbioplanes lichenis]|uniref:protein kinase domain-containing protein n=1 Tax=Symbioplanes lichenis TaxID=1629072 RepID=UPI00273A4D41|nr:protein kinase [Actinoplanes lichenis]
MDGDALGELEPGRVVGPWRVVRRIGAGSWSTVYEARRVDGGRPYAAALKVLPTGTPTRRQLEHLAGLADRELHAHRHLAHPFLLAIHGSWVVDDPASPGIDGATVLATELALESAADALAAGTGGLAGATRILAEVTAGLAYLHEAGWVHGDLKPSNVLLMADGSARLGDFGLSAELIGTHALLPPAGTMDFVPPERWAEELRDGSVPVRQTADVWALGVTACLLLTGGYPFAGVTARARAAAAAAYADGRAELRLPPALSPEWREFVAGCLSPDHGRRAGVTAASLARRARELSAVPAPGRRRRTVMTRTLVAAAAVLATAAGAGVLLGAGGPGGARDPEPGYERYFRTDAVPARYRDLIVRAGTRCPDDPAVTPVLVAAMLEAETGFDPDYRDPVADEYGIARWTPRVLQYYLPPGQRTVTPEPPFPPEMSIPPLGDYLCRASAAVEEVPGDREVNLALAFRTSVSKVRAAGGVPADPSLAAYAARLRSALATYRAVDPAPART